VNTLAFILISILLLLFLPLILAAPACIISDIEEWSEKRKIRKEYDRIIDNWKKLAVTETNQEQKGFEVAMLCNIAYEKNTLYPKGRFMK
jgi:hypothetical protein